MGNFFKMALNSELSVYKAQTHPKNNPQIIKSLNLFYANPNFNFGFA
jgi:hypothetical protein